MTSRGRNSLNITSEVALLADILFCLPSAGDVIPSQQLRGPSHMSIIMCPKDNCDIIIPSSGGRCHKGALDHLLSRELSRTVHPFWALTVTSPFSVVCRAIFSYLGALGTSQNDLPRITLTLQRGATNDTQLVWGLTLWFRYLNGEIECGLGMLASFSCQFLKILSWGVQYQDFHHLYNCILFHYIHIPPPLMNSSVDLIWCLYVFVIICRAVLNSIYQFLDIRFKQYCVYINGKVIFSFSTYWINSELFSTVTISFYVSTRDMWAFQFFHIALSTHMLSCFFGWSQHSWRYSILSQCAFDVHSLTDKMSDFQSKMLCSVWLLLKKCILTVLKVQDEGARTFFLRRVCQQ